MKKAIIIILIVVLLLALLFGLYYFFWTAENFATLGDRAMRNGRYSRAVDYYTKACDLNPENENFAISLAEACLANGNYTKAERTLVNAIRHDPDSSLYTHLSATYVAQDKLLDAQQMLDNITDAKVKAEIDALRPAAPTFTPEPGKYSEYISVSLTCDAGTVYVSTDRQYPSVAAGAYTEPIALPAGNTHVSAVAVAENGLVSPLAEADYLIVGVVEEVTFASPEFENYIRELLVISENTPVLTSDLWNLDAITVPETVTDYSDLKYCTNLKSLTIQGSSAEDYSFLSETTALETVDFSNSLVSVETLGYIGGLQNLKTLSLCGCALSNILPLADATAITTLDLSDNSISNIGVLSNFKELVSANLSRNAISSLAALEGLHALEELDVSENKIASIQPLAGCTKLRVLKLDDNQITSITPVSAMKELVTLTASKNALTDADGLAGCVNIEELDLSNNQLTNINALKNLVKLTRLDFSYNQVTELPDFSTASYLQQFRASNNQLSDISCLAGLASINYIDVDYNTEIKDIECLGACPMIVQINAFGTKVTKAKSLTDAGIVVHYDPTGSSVE